MRVLGVDPGLTRCGVGVVDGGPGIRPVLVDVGVIRTAPGLDHARRLLLIAEGLEEWILRHRPDAVAVEQAFAQHNLASVTGTTQAAGIAVMLAARHQIPAHTHTPSEVKAAITGSGRADKTQVTTMITHILRLSQPPRPADAADAVALATTHLWRGGAVNRYARVVRDISTRTRSS